MDDDFDVKFPQEDDSDFSVEIPESSKPKRASNVNKQAIAGLMDFASDIPSVLGFGGAAIEGGINYLSDDDPKRSFTKHFTAAGKEGIDNDLMSIGADMTEGTNNLLGIKSPISTEDILARHAALFLPIPGIRLARGASLGAKLARGAMDVALPTVKRGPLPNMLTRGGIQGSVGVGIGQGIRAIQDDPNHPLLFSDTALQGHLPITAPPLHGGPGTDSFTVEFPQESKDDFSVEFPQENQQEFTVDVPDQSPSELLEQQREMDARMQKERDWEDIKTAGIIAGVVLGGGYLTKRLRGPQPIAGRTQDDVSSAEFMYETVMDKGKASTHAFKRMGMDDITRQNVEDTLHTDVNGIAREAVVKGEHAQGFNNEKFPAHSSVVLDNDEAVLRQQGKDKLFNDAMAAQSEMASVERAGRDRSLWRKNLSDGDLNRTIQSALDDEDVAALMHKHAQNYRADLEYEVYRGWTTREKANELFETFGDITKGQRGTYMPFYGKSEYDFLHEMSRKFLGINTKQGDMLRTVAQYQARDGSLAKDIMPAGQAIKLNRLYGTAHVNDQLYKNEILSKLAGIMPTVKGFSRTLVKDGKIIPATRPMRLSETGRGTQLYAIADDIGTDPNNMKIRIVNDDPTVTSSAKSINDLRNQLGEKMVTVQHKGNIYVYNVPDAGIRAGLDLNPEIGKILQFNQHWKNIFTKFTTGEYSLFPVISHAFASQQTALTTAAEMGVGQGFKSLGRSVRGSKDMFLDQVAGLMSDHISRSIATDTGMTKNATKWQKTLHNRYSNSLLSATRAQTGRTQSGIGSTPKTLQEISDEFGKDFSDYYGVRQMGLVKNVWKAMNNAANEGAAYGAIQHAIGKSVEVGKKPNISQIRKAVEQSKTFTGDMSRRGSSKFIQGVNYTVPFSSAMFQSWNALGRAAKHDWKAFSLGAGALIGAPTMMELAMNAVTSKMTGPDGKPLMFADANGKMWTYDDYYWNGFTTQQRTDNIILMVPGRHPKDAIIYPISPEWGLFRSIVLESSDALFNLSQTGNIEVANIGKHEVGRDHFLGALHRLFDLPIPPLAAASLSKMGIDIRAGFNVNTGENPDDPQTNLNFLESIPVGQGERVTSRMGRTKDVNGYIEKTTSSMIKDIWGAGGSAYIGFVEAVHAGTTNVGGSLVQGLEDGLGSLLDSARRQARYTNPFGGVFNPNSNDEIASSLHGKRQALQSLSNDAKVLRGDQGYITVEGKQVAIDTVIRTQDPIRITLAGEADSAAKNIRMVDKHISDIRTEITKMRHATTLGSQRERQDLINAKQFEIQTWKAKQMAVLHTFEDIWSENLSKQFKRDIVINLSGGTGKTIAARPNLDSTSITPLSKLPTPQ